ncbi:hypothetical protein [Haematobacter massiliensis]|uniref:hypothetical protein n=1 Tax=Haematobacter massiliensis TaxID=195105 RepID=UPI0023F1A9AD|nr:hypothetical protein [Haematobacter massiliensis]
MADIVRMYSGLLRVRSIYHADVLIWSEAGTVPAGVVSWSGSATDRAGEIEILLLSSPPEGADAVYIIDGVERLVTSSPQQGGRFIIYDGIIAGEPQSMQVAWRNAAGRGPLGTAQVVESALDEVELISPPVLLFSNLVLTGSEVGRERAGWGAGVTPGPGGWVEWSGSEWIPSTQTGDEFIAGAGGSQFTWEEVGTDATGRTRRVRAEPVTVYAMPVVVTPATYTSAGQPGAQYTSTRATFSGYPTPDISGFVARQLGTTGAIELVAETGTEVEGYRYRPATRATVDSLGFETWDYGAGWGPVVTVPAVAPTVSLARTPSGAITQGDTVTLDAARTGTPDPTPVWEITRNGAPFTTAGGTWSRYIDDIEDGNYVVTVTVTNSAGTATDTLSFTAAAASTDVPPYVISNPNLPALTEGVEVTAPAATFGGTPVPTASQKIQRRLPPATTWEDTGTGLTFVPAANYVYSRLATVSNGVGPALVVRSAESGAVVQVDWAYTESDGVVTIVKSPGQPPTPSVTDITYNSARIVPGSVASPAVQRFLIMPDADFNEANPSLSSSGNIIKTEGINFQSPAPNVKLATFRRSANFDFTTLPAPALPKFADTFAGDGDLTGHTPEAGGVWLPPPSGANTLVKFLGRLRGTTGQATPAFNFSSSELAASGGYVEAVAVCLARKPGGIGAMPLAIDLNNHLIMNFVYHSTDPNLDGVYVSERRGGTSYPLLSYLIPNMSDGDQQHRARVEVSRATKNVRLIVDEVDRGGATYSGTYPAGTKMGARWAASTSTYPTPNGAVQLAEMLAGDL